jgi:hypothetical protein
MQFAAVLDLIKPACSSQIRESDDADNDIGLKKNLKIVVDDINIRIENYYEIKVMGILVH